MSSRRGVLVRGRRREDQSHLFQQGPPTKKIRYCDLPDLKIGKEAPITQAYFDDFLAQLPKRMDSPKSLYGDVGQTSCLPVRAASCRPKHVAMMPREPSGWKPDPLSQTGAKSWTIGLFDRILEIEDGRLRNGKKEPQR